MRAFSPLTSDSPLVFDGTEIRMEKGRRMNGRCMKGGENCGKASAFSGYGPLVIIVRMLVIQADFEATVSGLGCK